MQNIRIQRGKTGVFWHCLPPPQPSPASRTPSSSRYYLLAPNRLPFISLHFFSTCDMGDHYGPTRFCALFVSTLQAYTKSTGVSLAEHPLTLQLQTCQSVESITTLLQDQIVRTSSDFGENDRLEGSIKSTISILSTISATAPPDWAIGLVR